MPFPNWPVVQTVFRRFPATCRASAISRPAAVSRRAVRSPNRNVQKKFLNWSELNLGVLCAVRFMKANKLYSYFVVVNLIMLLLSAITDPPSGGIPLLVAMILLSMVFSIFCEGWRRFLAVCFIIIGVLMCFSEVQSQ